MNFYRIIRTFRRKRSLYKDNMRLFEKKMGLFKKNWSFKNKFLLSKDKIVLFKERLVFLMKNLFFQKKFLNVIFKKWLSSWNTRSTSKTRKPACNFSMFCHIFEKLSCFLDIEKLSHFVMLWPGASLEGGYSPPSFSK